jgi:hypothetical protein
MEQKGWRRSQADEDEVNSEAITTRRWCSKLYPALYQQTPTLPASAIKFLYFSVA